MNDEKRLANERHMKIVAEKLNGREYGHELDDHEAEQLKSIGLVVAFGYSDDNVEFRGAFEEEVGLYEEGVIHFVNGDVLSAPCYSYENCWLWENVVKKAKAIKAMFTSNGWEFETDIPHEEFTVMEDGEVYGKGIVFAYEDVGGKRE